MKYMLMIYRNKAGWDSLTQNVIDEIGRTHRAVQNELSASGELLDHKELALDNGEDRAHGAPNSRHHKWSFRRRQRNSRRLLLGGLR
jgi:hypothetical protein